MQKRPTLDPPIACISSRGHAAASRQTCSHWFMAKTANLRDAKLGVPRPPLPLPLPLSLTAISRAAAAATPAVTAASAVPSTPPAAVSASAVSAASAAAEAASTAAEPHVLVPELARLLALFSDELVVLQELDHLLGLLADFSSSRKNKTKKKKRRRKSKKRQEHREQQTVVAGGGRGASGGGEGRWETTRWARLLPSQSRSKKLPRFETSCLPCYKAGLSAHESPRPVYTTLSPLPRTPNRPSSPGTNRGWTGKGKKRPSKFYSIRR